MKTVQQIVNEYKNRQETPEYSQITIHPDPNPQGKVLVFDAVRNFETVYDKKTGRWLEFDSVYDSVSRHVRIKGYVNQFIEMLPENEGIKTFVAKDCVSVTVYTNSGKREGFQDVKNLSENKKSRQVEFDRIVEGDTTHIRMSGVIEKYEERLE